MSVLKALVDKLLTNVSLGYVPEGFIAEKALPLLKSKQSSGKIGKYGKEHLRLVSDIMGGKGEAKRIDIRQMSSATYFVEPHGLEEMITVEEYNNVEEPFDIEKDVTIQLTTLLKMGKEKALADTLRNPAIITQNVTLSGNDQWQVYGHASSTPLEDINLAKKTIRDGSGVVADTGICDYNVMETLRFHPTILRNLGFADNRAGSLTNEEIAKAFGLKRILVADVMYNSSKEGQADALAPLWGKDFIVAALPESAGKWQTSLGFQVQLSSEGSMQVFKQPVTNPPGAKSIIVKDSYDLVMTDVKAAYLIKDVIA